MNLQQLNKKYILICISCLTIFGSTRKLEAQNKVGISTNNPISTLDINGTTWLNGPLLLGGDESQPGSNGSKGEAMSSSGPNKQPYWQDISYLVTQNKDGYFLQSSYILNDTKGIIMPFTALSQPILYPEDTIFQTNNDLSSSKIYEIEGLKFTVPKGLGSSMIISARVQLGVMSDYKGEANSLPWNSYAIGIAVADPKTPKEKKLIAIRTSSCVSDARYPYSAFLMEYTIDADNLPENAILSIVCFYRNSYPTDSNQAKLYFGCGSPDSDSDNYLMSSLANFDIFIKL